MDAGCIICRELFDTGYSIVATKCGHVFHMLCLAQWCERSTACPECGSSIRKKDILKLTELYDSSWRQQSSNFFKDRLHEKNREISAKNRKIEKLTFFSQKDHMLHEYRPDKRNTDLKMMERNSHRLVTENKMLPIDLDNLNNVKTILHGCHNDAKTILKEYESCHSGNKQPTNSPISQSTNQAGHQLAELRSVLKQQLSANIKLKDQLETELNRLTSCYASHEENISKSLVDASSGSLCGNDSFETDSTSECAPKFRMVEHDNQINPIPLKLSESMKRNSQFGISDGKLPRIPTQVSQSSLLIPAPCVVPSTPEHSVSRVGNNHLGGNRRGLPLNISRIHMQVHEYSHFL